MDSAKTLPSISIIIPNYNGNGLLKHNLPSVIIAADNYPGLCNILVVDDASTELGSDKIVAEFDQIKYLSHLSNQGFGQTIGTGVAAVSTELVFLLNSDVQLFANTLMPLVQCYQQHNCFAVSPLIIDEHGSISRQSLNRKLFSRGRVKDLPMSPEKIATLKQPAKVLYCSGGSVLINTQKFKALGGFHKIYLPYYSEDVDLGTKAWRKGWPSMFQPASQVVHQEHGSIASSQKRLKVKTIQRRNHFYFLWSHLSLAQIIGYCAPYWLKQFIGRIIKGDKAYRNGTLTALSNLAAIRDHRQEIDNLTPSLSFKQVLDNINAEKLL